MSAVFARDFHIAVFTIIAFFAIAGDAYSAFGEDRVIFFAMYASDNPITIQAIIAFFAIFTEGPTEAFFAFYAIIPVETFAIGGGKASARYRISNAG